jgi:hypothetical protein
MLRHRPLNPDHQKILREQDQESCSLPQRARFRRAPLVRLRASCSHLPPQCPPFHLACGQTCPDFGIRRRKRAEMRRKSRDLISSLMRHQLSVESVIVRARHMMSYTPSGPEATTGADVSMLSAGCTALPRARGRRGRERVPEDYDSRSSCCRTGEREQSRRKENSLRRKLGGCLQNEEMEVCRRSFEFVHAIRNGEIRLEVSPIANFIRSGLARANW